MSQKPTKQKSVVVPLSGQIKQIYDKASILKHKYLMSQSQRNENQSSVFIPFHNKVHIMSIDKDQQFKQKKIGQLQKYQMSNSFKKSSKKGFIQTHILNQLKCNKDIITRYATMGNVLNITSSKKDILTCILPTQTKNIKRSSKSRYSSAKNFVIKNSQNQIVKSQNYKELLLNAKHSAERQKSKVIKMINFLKNSESRQPQIIKTKPAKLLSIQQPKEVSAFQNVAAEDQKNNVIPWWVLLKTKNPQIISQIQEIQQIQNQREFTPIGSAKHSRTNSRTESRTSFSVSTKKQSSYLSSRLLLCNTKKENSPKKYLRKGARIREALLKQLMDPNDPYHNDTNQMAYLRQYDQWVPSVLVDNKRQQLQQFMGIFIGAKRQQERTDIQLQKMQLVYL